MEDEQPTKKQRLTEIENEIDDKNFYDNIFEENKDAIITASIFADTILTLEFEIKFGNDGFVTSFKRLENNIDKSIYKSIVDFYAFDTACLTNHIVLAKYYAEKFPDKFVFELDESKKNIKSHYVNETNEKFEDCPICQETNNANVKLSDGCDHAFCDKCIREWGRKMDNCVNKKAVTCPLCRSESVYLEYAL